MTDGALRMQVFAFIALVLFGGLVARCGTCRDSRLSARNSSSGPRPMCSKRSTRRHRGSHSRPQRPGHRRQQGRRGGPIDRGIVDDLDPVERDAMFLRLAIAISRSGRLTKVDDIVDQYGDRSYGPFERVPVAVDVNPELLVFLGERQDQFPGVNVVQRTVRLSLRHDGRASARLCRSDHPNRVGGSQPADRSGRPGRRRYQLNHEIGKTGVELIFEDALRGVPGTRFIEVDASRKVVREYDYVPPVPGNDVWLSIDLDLQALAEQELATGLAAARSRTPQDGAPPNVAAAGGVVAIDPETGICWRWRRSRPTNLRISSTASPLPNSASSRRRTTSRRSSTGRSRVRMRRVRRSS